MVCRIFLTAFAAHKGKVVFRKDAGEVDWLPAIGQQFRPATETFFGPARSLRKGEINVIQDPKPERVPACILVVEDNVLVRALVADALRSACYSVVEADSADEALAYLSAGGQVDLLLTDVEMPGRFNGLELARQFHRAHPTSPIVVTSGHVQPEAAEVPSRFIPKPYDPEQVAKIVAEELESSRRGREE